MTDSHHAALRPPRAWSATQLAPAAVTAAPRRRRLDLAGRAVGIGALAGLVLLVAELVVGAAGRPSYLVPASEAQFPSWMSGVFHGLGAGGVSEQRLTVSLLAMFALYLLALYTLRWLTLPLVAGAIVVMHVVLALAPPLELTDLFNYVGFARLGAVHHLNPYAHGVIEVPRDPIVAFDSWRYLHSPYGPLFTLISYAIAPLGIGAALWVLKGVAAALSLACIAVLGLCARRLGRDPLPAVALLGLNPIVLFFGVGGGHNDFLLLLLLLGAITLTLAGREALGAAATIAAAGVKATAAIILPFQLLGSLNRGRALVAALASAALGLALSLALFGTHILAALRSQSECVSKLSVPDALGRLVGAGGAVTGVRVTLLVVLAATFVWQLRRTRPGSWLVPAGWTVLALLAALSWLMPWYTAWVLPLAALGGSRRLRIAALVACAYGLLVWVGPTASAIGDALPSAKPPLAGGCSRDGAHPEKKHRGWAQGYL